MILLVFPFALISNTTWYGICRKSGRQKWGGRYLSMLVSASKCSCSPAFSHLLHWGLQSMAGSCTFFCCKSSLHSIALEPLFARTAAPVTGAVGLPRNLQCWSWPPDSPLFLLRWGTIPRWAALHYCSLLGVKSLLLVPSQKMLEITQFPMLCPFLMKIPTGVTVSYTWTSASAIIALTFVPSFPAPSSCPLFRPLYVVSKMVLTWPLTHPLHIVFASFAPHPDGTSSSLWARTLLCQFTLFPNIWITLAHPVGSPMSNIQYKKSTEPP